MISDQPSSLTDVRARASEGRRAWPLGFIGAGLSLLVIAVAVCVRTSRDVTTLLDREDAQALEQSERMFDGLIEQKLVHLRSQVAVLAEDARIRSTVVTPQFDDASVADVLAELKQSAAADILAILSAEGRVRAVTGADEMKNLDLGTSSLIKSGLQKPSASMWTFRDTVRLLGVAPIQLGGHVLAMFMMGFDLGPSALAEIGDALGTIGGAFVGEALVAASSQDAAARGALKAAASKDTGAADLAYEGTSFVIRSSRPSQAAGAVKMVWMVPKHREASRMRLLGWLSWAPVVLVGLSVLLLLGLAARDRTIRT